MILYPSGARERVFSSNCSTACWSHIRPLSQGNSGTLTRAMSLLMVSLVIVRCNLINEHQRCGLLDFIGLFVGLSGDHLWPLWTPACSFVLWVELAMNDASAVSSKVLDMRVKLI